MSGPRLAGGNNRGETGSSRALSVNTKETSKATSALFIRGHGEAPLIYGSGGILILKFN